MPTTQISLIREHTERLRPPRAMFVPFSLGRPFGAPNEPAFQTRVMMAALGLLDRGDGPILEDFPDLPPGAAAGDDEDAMEGWTCPVNLAAPPKERTDAEKFRDALTREIALMRPWYEEAVKNAGGRRLDGLTPFSPEECVEKLMGFIADPGIESFIEGEPLPRAIKLCADDLKHFYYQAALARPAGVTDKQLDDWFFGATFAGRLFLDLRKALIASDDAALKRVGMMSIVPQAMAGHTNT